MRSRPLVLLLCLFGVAGAQEVEEAPPNGPRRIDPAWHALVGATVHVAPGRVLQGATVVLRGDRIDLSNKHTGLYAKYRAKYRQLGLVK